MGRKVFYFILFLHSSVQQTIVVVSSYPETSALIQTALCSVNCTACGRSSGASKLLKHSSLCTHHVYVYTQYTTPKSVRGYLPLSRLRVHAGLFYYWN